MFQRDYFMRMIEQMTEAIGQIMQLRRDRKQEEALLLIDDLLESRFRLSSKLVRSLSDEDLMKMMTTNGVVDTDMLAAIAVLVLQEARLQGDLRREDESYAAALKALQLFIRLSLLGEGSPLADPKAHIGELLEKLSPYELPSSTKRLLMEWHEAEGRFDQTENIMHELLDDEALRPEAAAGIYRRLLLQSDEKLEAGGLPREEIEQGLAALLLKYEEAGVE
ncbi:DUF6483 family protein [Paenibacillus arenilitoris]|uniref:Uncharacterized protein n=1 Tax=Paenibacillus arenilitoris TaxID=2772299 RepID=A0A927CQM2_9BACL|nr:DUF6483 family protein [Paenibacillus arenilitoris]MBD2872369.1 hypothetical protein [Paenibacillus arenilitoris]